MDWPYDANADHNAGFSTRTATIVKVEPLPPGTTDIDSLEAGWDFVDEGKIIFYGAIDPSATIKEKLTKLIAAVDSLDTGLFRNRLFKSQLRQNIRNAKWFFTSGHKDLAAWVLAKDTVPRVDGCKQKGTPDRNDWIKDCSTQNQVYWGVNEILVLIDIP